MKKILLFLLFIPVFAFAQNEDVKTHFKAGGGFSLGFFNPSKVNDYIDADIKSHSMMIQSGFSEMIMNFGGRVFVGYTTDANLGFDAFIEGALGPKIIKANNGSSITYLFNRLSPGVKLTYQLLINDESSLVFGAGPMYNRISFSDGDNKFHGSSLGGKFEIAYQYKMENFTPCAFINVDFAKVKDKYLEMNYTGIEIGFAISGNW